MAEWFIDGSIARPLSGSPFPPPCLLCHQRPLPYVKTCLYVKQCNSTRLSVGFRERAALLFHPRKEVWDIKRQFIQQKFPDSR
jgi:hypothetical protein